VGEEEVLTLQMYPLVFVLLCLAVRPVPAAPLTPDRPGEAETTSIVTPGAIQLEGGFGFARETKGDDPKTNTVTVPQLLMRVGLLPTVEAHEERTVLFLRIEPGRKTGPVALIWNSALRSVSLIS
jgi:hypothetical protein